MSIASEWKKAKRKEIRAQLKAMRIVADELLKLDLNERNRMFAYLWDRCVAHPPQERNAR